MNAKTKNSAGRTFAIGWSIVLCIGISAFIVILSVLPHRHHWIPWSVYAVALPVFILWGIRGMDRRYSETSRDSQPMPALADFSRERWFRPRFTGRIQLARIPDDYVERLQHRIRDGFLVKGHHKRSDYVSELLEDDGVHIRAGSFRRASNIGLNDVIIRRISPTELTYQVNFARWTRGAVILGGSIVAFVLPLLIAFPNRTVWRFDKTTLAPSLAETAFSITSLLFWGIAWPWVLTEMHKKPAARCLERILRETLGEPSDNADGPAT